MANTTLYGVGSASSNLSTRVALGYGFAYCILSVVVGYKVSRVSYQDYSYGRPGRLQIITDYEVYDERPADSALLTPSIERHIELFGRAPDVAAADAGFFSASNEAKAEELGVKRVVVPSQSTQSPQRKNRQKQRWFKKAQKWRTGCEGRISVLKRRHGLERSPYKGTAGMKRFVGFGVMADNLINIGRALSLAASN